MCGPAEPASPEAVFERHALKGAKEQCFSQLLSDLDLQYPPCLELIANQMFYAIATLAYNILVALRVMELPDEAQGWRIQSMVRHLLTVPVVISRHARYRRAKVCASRMARLVAVVLSALGTEPWCWPTDVRAGGFIFICPAC